MLVLRSYFRVLKYGLLIAVLLCASCDNAGEAIVPTPERVHMVYHTLADDTLAIEHGIDAVWENNGIYVAWYDLKDRNIKQYNVYRRRDDESYFRIIKRILIEQSKDTTYVDDDADRGLDLNIYYHYFVTATNSQDDESRAADTLKYKLLSKPETRQPDGQTFASVLDTLPVLTWDFVDIPNYYILRIENNFSQLHYAGIFQVADFFESQTLDLKSVPDLPQFSPGTYKWRIDTVGPDEDNSGSESVWKTFIIE